MSIVANVSSSNHARFAPAPWDTDDSHRLALEQRLAPNHVARHIDPAVDRLDRAPLFASYAGRGSAAYRPDLLLKAVLSEVPRGYSRPADGLRHAHENEPVRWLLRGTEPSHARWYAFRDRLHDHLDGWVGQLLRLAVQAGLPRGTQAALDGTSVEANASRHRLLNHEAVQRRLAEREAACAADAAGTAPAALPGWMAKPPASRCQQRQRYHRVAEALARRRQRNQQKRPSKRTADDKVVIRPADPEAALGRDQAPVYRPLYNVQYVYALDAPLVLAWEVFAQPNDAGTLGPMLQRVEALDGHGLTVVLVDAAYAGGVDLAVAVYAPWQSNDASASKRKGQTPKQLPKELFVWQEHEGRYECPQGHPLELVGRQRQKRSGTEAVRLFQYRCDPRHCQACPLQKACTPNPRAGRSISRSEHEPLREALKTRMETVEGKAL